MTDTQPALSPLVSVITPTKNRLTWLLQAIDSVQRQTLANWEHLIVDDGSTDGSEDEVVRRGKSDPRIRYIKRTGRTAGANVCRNIGIREARADLAVFLDSDDVLRPQCLEERVSVISANRALDFAVWPAGVFRHLPGDIKRLYHPQMPGDDLLRFLSLECPWEISGPIWRRTFLEQIDCFDESLLSMQDLEMHVRAVAAGGRYIFLSSPDHDIRGQDDAFKTSVRHFNEPDYIRAIPAVREKLQTTVGQNGLLTWTRKRALLGLDFGAAEGMIRMRHMPHALRVWNSACRDQHASYAIRAVGLLMLGAKACSRSDADIASRLVNKWKGWVRFRPEPSLLPTSQSPTALGR